MKTDRSPASFCKEEIIEIYADQLSELKRTAMSAGFRRARLCLHHNHSDKVQEMIIAFCRDSYVRPHRHRNKSESFHIIEGELLVIIFDNDGRVTQKIKMAPYGGDSAFLYRLSSELWHTVVPLTEFVVIHETTTGPFIKEEGNFPVWGPEETDLHAIKAFLAKITA